MIVMERTTGVVTALTDSALAFFSFLFFSSFFFFYALIPLSLRYLDTYFVYYLENGKCFSHAED